jgi:hypothetical protein
VAVASILLPGRSYGNQDTNALLTVQF